MDYWKSQWIVILVLCLLQASYYIKNKLNSYPAALWFLWSSLMGLWVFAGVDNYYMAAADPIHWAFSAESTYSTFALLLVGVALLTVDDKYLSKIGRAFGVAGFISALWVLLRIPWLSEINNGGFFGNASVEGCFIAVTMSLSKNKWFRLTSIFSVIALFVCAEATQPLAVFSIIFLIWLSKEDPLIALFFSGILIILLCLSPPSSNGRFAIYSNVINWLNEMPSRWVFGMGLGSFQTWAQLLKDNFFPGFKGMSPFLHSDILQTVFETGLIGLGLGIATFIQAVKRSWNTDIGFALIAYALTMLFNYPTHLGVHAFLGMFLLVSCQKGQTSDL